MLNENERQQLAEKLADLPLGKARKEIRRLDSDANLKVWRNSVQRELQTVYELPNLGVRVILVEQPQTKPIEGVHKVKMTYFFTEARVEPWTPPLNH